MITVVCGGVGAARYLRGLVRVVDAGDVTAVVNTGDDLTLHGLRICPDLDTVTYTLADGIDPERGWGLAGETWAAMGALDRYGGTTWFRLGDRDLATHLFRTGRLHEGVGLTEITAEVAAGWGVGVRLLPMTEDPVATRFTLPGGEEITFQEYFVQRQHDVPVTAVRFAGVELARPGPGVLDALESAERVVVAPSNPVVSIGPVGVARRYAPFVGTLVVDDADADRAAEVEAEGVRCVVAPTIMKGPAESAALAEVTLSC